MVPGIFFPPGVKDEEEENNEENAESLYDLVERASTFWEPTSETAEHMLTS